MSGESELSSDVSNGAENEVGKAYKVDHGMPLRLNSKHSTPPRRISATTLPVLPTSAPAARALYFQSDTLHHLNTIYRTYLDLLRPALSPPILHPYFRSSTPPTKP